MTTPLFRQEVIEAGRDRLQGIVVAATPPRSGVYAALLLSIAAAIAAILLFGHYAARSQVKGIVTYEAGMARVYPATTGEIRQIHVREGMQVAAGTPLATLALAQGPGGLGEQLAGLEAQEKELERQQQLAGSLGTAEAQSLQRQQAGLTAAIASLERQRALAAGQVRLAEAAIRRAFMLAREGAGTQRQVEESRAAALERRAAVESLTERIATERETLRAIDSQIQERLINASRSQSEVAAQRAVLAQQRSELTRQERLVLTAPITGIVEHVAAQVGQRARPEASVVTIVPVGSRIEVWLYAPSRAIGLVRPGQEVRLLFDAFPYQRYGAGRGRVTEISRLPIEPAALDPALGIEEPVFRVRVAVEAAPRAATVDGRLRAGMTLTANLVLERRPLWEVLFNPFATALRG